ncbi:IQ motif containing with AAA domain 1 [Phyllostomus discolor]|uniref:IQ motif containing with AAA domain 1 n=1 Tax=Phyllostomus discolor TaxID=89673 RepID=A0A834ARG2_9CHIR|nr:IQ motif containing with AAA domain 1 [Phyllostomus discolor]
MSNITYNQMWRQTQEALNSLLDKESQKRAEPPRSEVFIFQMLATFYIKYVQIFRNLEDAYDQMVHPQKRILIRKVLDGVMGRILELKNEMVELELAEFHYFDNILQDLKLTPQQLDIPIPKYFLKEKVEVIKEREKILAQILADSGVGLPMKSPSRTMPLEDAVKAIQTAERARQGRLRALFMKHIFLQEFKARHSRIIGERIADVGSAALRIQKVSRAGGSWLAWGPRRLTQPGVRVPGCGQLAARNPGALPPGGRDRFSHPGRAVRLARPRRLTFIVKRYEAQGIFFTCFLNRW